MTYALHHFAVQGNSHHLPRLGIVTAFDDLRCSSLHRAPPLSVWRLFQGMSFGDLLKMLKSHQENPRNHTSSRSASTLPWLTDCRGKSFKIPGINLTFSCPVQTIDQSPKAKPQHSAAHFTTHDQHRWDQIASSQLQLVLFRWTPASFGRCPQPFAPATRGTPSCLRRSSVLPIQNMAPGYKHVPPVQDFLMHLAIRSSLSGPGIIAIGPDRAHHCLADGQPDIQDLVVHQRLQLSLDVHLPKSSPHFSHPPCVWKKNDTVVTVVLEIGDALPPTVSKLSNK